MVPGRLVPGLHHLRRGRCSGWARDALYEGLEVVAKRPQIETREITQNLGGSVVGAINKYARFGTLSARNMHPAGTCLHVAREYLEAAKTLHLHPTPKTGMIWLEDVPKSAKFDELSFPLFFCLAHASELMLKGFLTANGKGKETDGWRNHDIKALLDACLALGLVITENTHSLLDDLGSENSDFTFRFHERTSPVFFPPTKSAIRAVEELDQSVSPAVSPFLATQRADSPLTRP
jgi:hypothetical protein